LFWVGTPRANTKGKEKTKTVRIIKKYPNRRLYDTKYSQYITLDDIHRLVKNKKPFQVIDTKNGSDLTRSTLLQIISHLEKQSQHMLTPDLLMAMIRYYDEPMVSLLSRYLEHSLAVFREHQADLKSPMNTLLDKKSQINLLHDLAKESISDWLVKK